MKGDVNASQPCPPLSVGLLSSPEKLFRAVAGSCQEFNVQHNLGAQCGASGGNHDAEMSGTVLECSEGGGIFGCSTRCRQERGAWTS